MSFGSTETRIVATGTMKCQGGINHPRPALHVRPLSTRKTFSLCRSQYLAHCPAVTAEVQASPLQSQRLGLGQMLADTAAPGNPAYSAGSLHNHTDCHVPCDKLGHDHGCVSQFRKAPLLEIAVNTNCASAFEQRACQVSQLGKAGVELVCEAGLGLSARQECPSSCRTGDQHALKRRLSSSRVSNIPSGGSICTNSSIKHHPRQQHSAAHQTKHVAHNQTMRQRQGRQVQTALVPDVLPKHVQLVSLYSAGGQHQHANAVSCRKQAAVAGQQAKGSHKASSSTGDRRKALMKAIVRTTPTRAPSMPVEATQSSSSGTAKRPSSQLQCEGIDTGHSQSSSDSCAMSGQSWHLSQGKSYGSGWPVLLPTSGLQPGPRSAFGHPSNAGRCMVLPGYGSGIGHLQDAQHAQFVAKDAIDASLRSCGTKAVRRSLLLQPDFC